MHSFFFVSLIIVFDLQKALVKRLYSLFTIKDSAAHVPRNLEARRRLQFFTNSLFMDVPPPKSVRKMLSFRYFFLHTFVILSKQALHKLLSSFGLFFSVFTPYYSEVVLYSMAELTKRNEDGISILFYLQKIYPGIHFLLKISDSCLVFYVSYLRFVMFSVLNCITVIVDPKCFLLIFDVLQMSGKIFLHA